MKIGDWVFFKTRNWPKGVQYTRIDPATGQSSDITGQGFYSGRGKVIGMAGEKITVREEKSNRLVEVGLHPDDEILSLGIKYATLTLGDVRAFLEQYKDAPDTVPVTIALPLAFFSDEEDLPPDHPEYKAVSACESVDANSIALSTSNVKLAQTTIPERIHSSQEGMSFALSSPGKAPQIQRT